MARRQKYSDLATAGRWNGQVRFRPEVLDAPLDWRAPRVVAVDWMGDIGYALQAKAMVHQVARIFGVMAYACQHTYLVLTKRPAALAAAINAARFREVAEIQHEEFQERRMPLNEQDLTKIPWPPKNVFLGTSAENQAMLDARLPELFRCGPGWKYWVSLEPLLGPIAFRWAAWEPLKHHPYVNNEYDGLRRLDGVVLGGETGPGARPMEADWARRVRDDCAAAGIPYFFKGWGQWAPHRHGDGHRCQDKSPCTKTDLEYCPRGMADRLLDGQQHNDLAWGKP
jgi:protein gp37